MSLFLMSLSCWLDFREVQECYEETIKKLSLQVHSQTLRSPLLLAAIQCDALCKFSGLEG